MNLRKSAQWNSNLVFGGSWIVMLLGLTLLLITCAGCAGNRPILHPTENDFFEMQTGYPSTPIKDGYFMSAYYLCEVMGVDVDGKDCKDVK